MKAKETIRLNRRIAARAARRRRPLGTTDFTSLGLSIGQMVWYGGSRAGYFRVTGITRNSIGLEPTERERATQDNTEEGDA